MKVELPITEIASRLGVSERTALRRIADGKLLAKKLGANRYLVSTEDIEDLAPRAKVSTLAEQITSLVTELEALRQEVKTLQDRVTQLEQARPPASQPTTRSPETRTASDKKKADKPAAIGMAEVPEGSITFNQLIAELGIARATLREHIKNKGWEHIAIPKPNRSNEYDRYFTPEQAQVVRDWYARRGKS